MPRGPSTKYSGLFLDSLRDAVIDRYKKNNEGIVEREEIKTPGDNRSKHYEKFQADIKVSTEVLMSLSTLYKLLYRKVNKTTNKEILGIDKSFENATIETLEDYVNKTRTTQGIIKTLIIPKYLKGAEIIDSKFRSKLEADGFTHTYLDFFLAKNDNYCQWYGIVRNWDYKEREPIEKIKQLIKECFNWESRVSAVIHGAGGSGKSTFLRRVAIDHINQSFVVLWVNDLGYFCDEDLIKISGTSTKYLVFIEDWYSVEKDTALTTRFLNRIKASENLRVIIGDHHILNKDYRKQVLGDNYFEISAQENGQIISKILDLIPEWRDIAEKVQSKLKIYDSPLFLILFILARTSTNINFKTKDVLSQFKTIIRNEQNVIFRANAGLSLALYYYACFYSKYKTYLSWKAVLLIADFHNNNNKTSLELAEFNVNNPIIDIISHYISLVRHPLAKFNQTRYGYLCVFHHHLLAEEGLSQRLSQEWYFDPSTTKLEKILKQSIIGRSVGSELWFSRKFYPISTW